MSIQKKPYLIVPLLIEQSTWGGTYICEKKEWAHKEGVEGKKFGQSYELYSKSLLAASITSTNDPLFSPKVENIIPISIFAEERPFPLIKFTQAKGNSFQLHVKPGVLSSPWRSKAESWYFFENGKITYGVKKGIRVEDYKNTCHNINNKMQELSRLVTLKKLELRQAEIQAQEYIAQQNPHQYVNVYSTKKGDVVDLSGGGLHHSWEEDNSICPMGNILYEIQQDIMDPVSTLRSFDQGKFTKDGAVRELQIDEYFKYIDLDEKRNTLLLRKKENGSIFDTPHYSLISIHLATQKEGESVQSFHHLFVKEGELIISDNKGNDIFVGRGHSCFIPQGVRYSIKPKINSEILLTYLQ